MHRTVIASMLFLLINSILYADSSSLVIDTTKLNQRYDGTKIDENKKE